MVIDVHNHASGPQTCLRCRAIRYSAHNEHAMIDRQIVLRRQYGIDVNPTYAQGCPPGMGDLARLNDLRRNEPHAVGWNRESYPVGGRIEFGVNSTERRDPNQVALQIYHGPTT